MTPSRDFKFFFYHLIIYGGLLLLYYVLVLRFLTGWLLGLFHQHRLEYALAAIVLMIGQAVGLEIISYFLIKLLRRKEN